MANATRITRATSRGKSTTEEREHIRTLGPTHPTNDLNRFAVRGWRESASNAFAGTPHSREARGQRNPTASSLARHTTSSNRPTDLSSDFQTCLSFYSKSTLRQVARTASAWTKRGGSGAVPPTRWPRNGEPLGIYVHLVCTSTSR